MLATPPFYTTLVLLTDVNSPTPLKIWNSEKFYPFFADALGVIDGTHINCTPFAADCDATRNRKGVHSQNCLAVYSFNLCFTYFMFSWEGSTHDLTLFHNACRTDLCIPEGKYYLADAEFALLDMLLCPLSKRAVSLGWMETCQWSVRCSYLIIISHSCSSKSAQC